MVQVKSVQKAFGQGQHAVKALKDVSVDIASNEFFTLLGPSGCGKTTLLRCIAGFEQLDAGSIVLDGEDLAKLPPHKRPVNTVFQNYALFPHLTVSQNIAFGLEALKWPKPKIDGRVAEMLTLVQMENLARRQVSQISGGQQQRVALARAMAPRPKLLLLDEPLSALDFKLRREMQLELKRIQQETEITFIFVTHDQTEALTMSDRIGVMNGGELLQVDTPKEIYGHPACRFVAEFIGETNFLSANATPQDDGMLVAKLRDGSKLVAKGVAEGDVTLSIRPERVQLAATGLPAKVEQTVFFGTDINVHLRLRSDEQFILRLQNQGASDLALQNRQDVHLAIEPEAIQILVD